MVKKLESLKRGERPSSFVSTKRLLGYSFWILWAGILGFQIFQPAYDWDLDTFFYLGNQFGQGKLLFVDNFDIKLPIIQVIFWLPQILGGIVPWRLFTGISVAFSTYYLVKNLFNLIAPETSREKAFMTSGFALVITFSLPGAESAHISMFAAALFSGGLALSISSIRARQASWRIAMIGVLITLAILIRPNYGFVALFPIGLMYLRNRNWSLQRFVNASLALTGGSVFAVALVVAPYLLAPGGLNALLDGLLAIGSFSEGRSAGFVAIKQFVNRETFLPYIALYTSVLALPLLFTRFSKQLGFLAVAIAWAPLLMAIGLNLSFLLSHFHDHYIQLFLPITIMILVVLALALNSSAMEWERLFSLTVVMLLFVSPLADLWTSHRNLSARSASEFSSRESRVQENLRFLEVMVNSGHTFWVADSPYYHWKLSEPRIGDAHPAIARSLLSGETRWSSVVFEKYDLGQDYCNLLENSRKDLLIVEGVVDELNGHVAACLDRSSSFYLDLTSKSNVLAGSSQAHKFERVYLRRDLAKLVIEAWK